MSSIIDDFHSVNWKDRNVKIVFDSDAAYKDGIQKALRRLRSTLIQFGANPHRVDLPYVPGEGKCGLDDFLLRHRKKPIKAFNELKSSSLFLPDVMSGEELLRKKFPKNQWIVKGLIPIGVTMIAGPPKVGKSWLVLSLVAAITTGKPAINFFDTVECDALYLALEDTGGRLQTRLKLLEYGSIINGRSHFATEWPRVENDGLLALERLLDQHASCKVVFIDTFQRMRLAPTKNGQLYAEDYYAISVLKQIADQRSIAIVVVHHLNKSEKDDIFERVSGSTGLTGAADTLMVLVRDRANSEGTLHITGRDIEEKELALDFQRGFWKVIGEVKDVCLSGPQQQIFDAVQKAGKPLGPTEIGRAISKEPSSIMKTIQLLVSNGKLKKAGSGKYELVQVKKPKWIAETASMSKGKKGNK